MEYYSTNNQPSELQKAYTRLHNENEELKAEGERLKAKVQAFLSWLEGDEIWNKTWQQVMSEWKAKKGGE